jgi:hypothetical protein
LGEHAASSATPTNGTSSMKWRRLVKFGIMGTFGKYCWVVGKQYLLARSAGNW